jgi:hypothetical protein
MFELVKPLLIPGEKFRTQDFEIAAKKLLSNLEGKMKVLDFYDHQLY